MENKILHIADRMMSLTPMIRKKIGRPVYEELPAINHTHFMILLILKSEGSLSVSEIGRKLVISKPNMTPLIDKLIKAGFVRRIPDEKDRRIVKIELTEGGIEYLTIRRAKNVEFMKEKLDVLPPEELDPLMQALEVVISSLEKLA